MRLTSDIPIDSATLENIPALQASMPWGGVSSKYSFLSTAKVITALRQEGLHPYTVKTSCVRHEKQGYNKHLIRFRQHDSQMIDGMYPEVILTNSHDRSSSFRIEAGLFRLVCSNGLVICASGFGNFRVRHVNTSIGQVLDAVYRITQQFPNVISKVDSFKHVQLSIEQQEEYAKLAMGLRWPDADKVPFNSARLLSYRRKEDSGTDLWSVFNVVQENLTQGQYHGLTYRIRSTRPITSVTKDLSINRQLWALTEQFAKV